jgi:hypothetical protein
MGLAILVGVIVIFVIGFACGIAIQEDKYKVAYAQREKSLRNEMAAREQSVANYAEERRQEFVRLVEQTKEFDVALRQGMLKGRNWLASAFAEFVDTRNLKVESWLVEKPHPASTAADQVARIRQNYRQVVQRLKLLEMQIASYEEYFPFLLDYRDAILDESVDLRQDARDVLDDTDPSLSRGYLSKEEYSALPATEKFQLALHRYWKREKSSWEIGRVYERYLGHLYERDGWRVTYHGILKGLEDFGRDLICVKGDAVHIVQCKCWSQNKQIREKHIFQLYGTSILFRLQLLGRLGETTEVEPIPSRPRNDSLVTAVFATTTALSVEALAVSQHLGVVVRREELKSYPMIKCNINPTTQERIYHLPFDQQYDSVIIGNVPGEFYAATVAEAEGAGFRRAFRWRGLQEGGKA